MNAARSLLGDLDLIGARVEPAGDRLILCAGPVTIPAALVHRVREAKADLMATLAAHATGAVVHDDEYTEHFGGHSVTCPNGLDDADIAAVASETGEVPLPYADAFTRLQAARPNGVDGARWLMAIRDAGIFLDRWRQIAFSLGWPAADLFEWTANGAAGLVWEIRGGEVTELTDDLALIENTSWACFACFARPTRREQCLPQS